MSLCFSAAKGNRVLPEIEWKKRHLQSLIQNITVWKRGAQRAPHKPLLLLYALARSLRNRDRFIPYLEIDEKLEQLLIDFGPTRKSYHPEYPFWRIQNDGIWELKNAKNVRIISSGDPRRNDLMAQNVSGGFPKDIFDLVVANPETTTEIAATILETAHIKWHQAGGPDVEENGIALCALHHKLFDRGAFTVSPELRIQVSDRAHGTHGFNEWLSAYHGKSLTPPQHPDFYPEPGFVQWYMKEIFQGGARYAI